MLHKQFTLLMIGTLFLVKVFGQKIVEDENVLQVPVTSSFNTIEINGHMEVWLSQDATESMAISADKLRDRDAIHSDIRDGVLHIWGGSGKNKSESRVYISFKTLQKVQLDGLVKLTVIGSIQQPALSLVVSGVSIFDAAVNVEKLEVTISGVGMAKLEGKAREAVILCSGSGNYDGSGLGTDLCTNTSSGSTLVRLGTMRELTVTASGSSLVKYAGEPAKKHQTLSGSAQLVKDLE